MPFASGALPKKIFATPANTIQTAPKMAITPEGLQGLHNFLASGFAARPAATASRMATASALVLEAGAAGALARTGGGVADSLVMALSSGYRSNLMPCASGRASE